MTSVGLDIEMSRSLRSIGSILNRSRISRLTKFVAESVTKRLGKYLFERSLSRHKTADRLGAKRTGVLEFTESCPSYSRGGGRIEAESQGMDARIVISGVPGLSRAFGDMVITPKRAKALTIPISREAYAKRAAELEREGWQLFVPRRKRNGKRRGVLMGKRGSTVKPMYRFAHSVTVKHDRNLLPQRNIVAHWAQLSAIRFLKGDT